MEYDKEDGADGSIPEFGAIFMANTITMRECFRRNVFALPSSKTKFVKQVKAGMVLFLFEYEKRQLFGVFQASSDGAIDIVPHAFNYSAKPFPAQVCFTLIWRCKPLPEKEIRDAIRENYFSPNKFKFGLSEDQVHRLLTLFSSRKMINKLPPHLLGGLDYEVACEDRGVVGDVNYASNERTYMEPSKLRDYQGNPLSGATEDERLIDDVVHNEDKIYHLAQGFLTDYHDGFLSKRRIVNYGNGLSVNNDSENKISNDHGMSRSSCIGPILNSVDDVRRSVDERRVLTVENENQAGKDLNSVNSNKYSVGPLEARTADYDQVMQRNRLFSECNLDNGFGQAFANKHCYKPLNENRHAIENCIHCKYNVLDIIKPVFCGHKNLNLPAHARETTDDHQCLMNMKSENRYHVERQSYPDSISDLRHKASKPKFGTCSMPGFLSENHARQLHCDCRARFRKSDGVENFEDIHAFVNPVVSTEYSSFSKPKQNMSSFGDKCLQERELSWLNVAQDFVSSRKTYDDTIISRDEPYIPELPKFAHRCSVSDHVIEHVPCKHMDTACSTEAKDSTIGVYHRERESSSYDNQHFKFSSNLNLNEQQVIPEAPHSDSNIRRRSVFTRLTSGQDIQVGKERNDDQFNFNDHYMDASVNEVMEMFPPRKLKKVRVVEQPKHNESALFDISHTTLENKKVEDAYVAIEEDTDEAPIETRVVDFKHRSEKRKSFISYAAPDNHREVESPTKKILKCRKLVRPFFGKAVESTCNYHNLQSSEKAIGTCGGELPKDIAGHQSMHCNLNEHSNNLEEQKEISRLEVLLKE